MIKGGKNRRKSVLFYFIDEHTFAARAVVNFQNISNLILRVDKLIFLWYTLDTIKEEIL